MSSNKNNPRMPPWVWVPIVIEILFDKLTSKLFRRKDESDHIHMFRQHPPVYCIADLMEPPPRYQQERNAPPAIGELEILQAELYRCQTQSSGGNPIERELLDADAAHLNRWIEQLEYLVYMEAATTIPQRYQRESITTKIFSRIVRRNE